MWCSKQGGGAVNGGVGWLGRRNEDDGMVCEGEMVDGGSENDRIRDERENSG